MLIIFKNEVESVKFGKTWMRMNHTKTLLLLLSFVVVSHAFEDNSQSESKGRLAITISAQLQNIEVSWLHLELIENGTITLTNGRLGEPGTDALLQIIPSERNDWITTDVYYNYSHFRDMIDTNTNCYGFWVYYLNVYDQTIYSSSCLRAYPRWMNEIKDHIKDYRFRDLFVPGSHDSASYRMGFDPRRNETLVSKYTLTQDDDIRGQLLHGIRYLDLRIGYYRRGEPQFWANHGISRQQPLEQVLRDIYDFVMETNEIVIVDFQEFPVGFGKTLAIHKNLIQYVKQTIGDMVLDLSDTWRSTFERIWAQPKRIILGYDHIAVVDEFHSFTFIATQQRWANTDSLSNLKRHLVRANDESSVRFSPRPVTDMAELTPEPWGVISDRYGGLRKMADDTNKKISEWYFKDFGPTANIVAVDFFKGTTIVQTAIYWNVYRSQFRANNTKRSTNDNIKFHQR